MKVYQLRLILGKATNYDQSGKLKNQTITAKYAGEMELENILEDQNWKKLGACEISCVGVFDTETKEQDAAMIVKINDRLKADIQAGIKPKTEIELLKEQIASLTEKVNNPVVLKNQVGKEVTGSEEVPLNWKVTDTNLPTGTDEVTGESKELKGSIVTTEKESKDFLFRQAKELRESLFAEAKELNLTVPKNVKTDILKDLIAKAKKA